MGTLKDAVDRVVAAKDAINTAITDKGGTVNPGDGLEDAATNIGTIPGELPEVHTGEYTWNNTTINHPMYGTLKRYTPTGGATSLASGKTVYGSTAAGAFFSVPEDGTIRKGAYQVAWRYYNPPNSSLGGFGYTVTPGRSNVSIGAPATSGASLWLANGFVIKGDANLLPANIKSGVTIFNVAGTAPNPTGNIDITTTDSVNVTNYATAKVVDANLKAENIKKDVSILGVTGTMESGGGGGGGGGLAGGTLTVRCVSSMGGYIDILYADGTTDNVYLGDGDDFTAEHALAIVGSGVLGGSCGALYLVRDYAELDFGCLLRGTMITLADGSTKPIEDLTYDDMVMAWDFDSGKLASARPFWLKKAERAPHYWVNTFASGRVVKTTGTVAGHRFFDLDTQRFEYNTDCVGHRVETLDGPDVLLSADLVHEECEFYNLNTEHHINCYADGVLASCRLNNLYRIENMTFVEPRIARHRRAEFPGVPDYWIDGGRFLEQPLSTSELAEYALEREEIRK